VGRGGALPGWAWRVRACDVMALPRKGPDIFAMMPGHACPTSSRERGDNRLTARHAQCRVLGRLQGTEWLKWAKLQGAVLAPDGAAAAPLFWLGWLGWAVAAHCTGRTCLSNQSPRIHGHDGLDGPRCPRWPRPSPARARRSERTAAHSFLFHPRLTSITQRLLCMPCHIIIHMYPALPWTDAHHDVDSSCRALGQPRCMGGALHMPTRYLLLHPCRALMVGTQDPTLLHAGCTAPCAPSALSHPARLVARQTQWAPRPLSHPLPLALPRCWLL
jgi:hypothetical protein